NQPSSYSMLALHVSPPPSPSTTLFRSNAGTVTFQVKNGATNVGSAVMSGTVSGGAASVTYSLPAGTAVGPYTIVATYNPSTNFTDSTDTKTNSSLEDLPDTPLVSKNTG